jgi:hypothetical protein
VTPEDELLATIRTRGVRIEVRGASLHVEPLALVTEDEIALIKANAETIAALLRHPAPPPTEAPKALTIDLDINNAVLRERAAEAARAEAGQAIAPPTRRTLYRVGQFEPYVPLHQLTAAQVQRLRTSGHITDEATREWLALQDKKHTSRRIGVL